MSNENQRQAILSVIRAQVSIIQAVRQVRDILRSLDDSVRALDARLTALEPHGDTFEGCARCHAEEQRLPTSVKFYGRAVDSSPWEQVADAAVAEWEQAGGPAALEDDLRGTTP